MIYIVLLVVCIALYIVSGVACALVAVKGNQTLKHFAKYLYLAAFILHSVFIGLSSVSTAGTLLTGPNIAMLGAWVIAGVALVMLLFKNKAYTYAMFSAPAIVILILISFYLHFSMYGDAISNAVYYRWPMLVVHIVLVFLAAACFMVSAAASGTFLYQSHLMQKHSVQILRVDTPALNTLSRVGRVAILAGVVLFFVAMLIGFIRLVVLGDAHVIANVFTTEQYLLPRIIFSLVVFAIYCLYLVFAYFIPYSVSGKTRAILSLIGFVGVVVLIVVSAW